MFHRERLLIGREGWFFAARCMLEEALLASCTKPSWHLFSGMCARAACANPSRDADFGFAPYFRSQ